jgi:hypothetical protein
MGGVHDWEWGDYCMLTAQLFGLIKPGLLTNGLMWSNEVRGAIAMPRMVV